MPPVLLLDTLFMRRMAVLTLAIRRLMVSPLALLHSRSMPSTRIFSTCGITWPPLVRIMIFSLSLLGSRFFFLTPFEGTTSNSDLLGEHTSPEPSSCS